MDLTNALQSLMALFVDTVTEISTEVNNPAASNGASNLQRCSAAGYVTLAAFAKYPCKHGYLAHCSRESQIWPKVK